MKETECRAPVPFETLIEYWLDELSPAESERIDEHLILCDACSNRLGEIVALSHGIGAAFRKGEIGVILTGDFVAHLVRQGVRVREYRVPRNGSVACTVTLEDDLLVAHLEVPLAGVTRIDALSRRSVDDAEQRLYDIPFDARSGEVVVAPSVVRVRPLPSHVRTIRLIAVEGETERLLGEYTFNHRAHDGSEI